MEPGWITQFMVDYVRFRLRLIHVVWEEEMATPPDTVIMCNA
jgi:hypothetical protein